MGHAKASQIEYYKNRILLSNDKMIWIENWINSGI